MPALPDAAGTQMLKSAAQREAERLDQQSKLLEGIQQEEQRLAQHRQEQSLKLNPHVAGKGQKSPAAHGPAQLEDTEGLEAQRVRRQQLLLQEMEEQQQQQQDVDTAVGAVGSQGNLQVSVRSRISKAQFVRRDMSIVDDGGDTGEGSEDVPAAASAASDLVTNREESHGALDEHHTTRREQESDFESKGNRPDLYAMMQARRHPKSPSEFHALGQHSSTKGGLPDEEAGVQVATGQWECEVCSWTFPSEAEASEHEQRCRLLHNGGRDQVVDETARSPERAGELNRPRQSAGSRYVVDVIQRHGGQAKVLQSQRCGGLDLAANTRQAVRIHEHLRDLPDVSKASQPGADAKQLRESIEVQQPLEQAGLEAIEKRPLSQLKERYSGSDIQVVEGHGAEQAAESVHAAQVEVEAQGERRRLELDLHDQMLQSLNSSSAVVNRTAVYASLIRDTSPADDDTEAEDGAVRDSSPGNGIGVTTMAASTRAHTMRTYQISPQASHQEAHDDAAPRETCELAAVPEAQGRQALWRGYLPQTSNSGLTPTDSSPVPAPPPPPPPVAHGEGAGPRGGSRLNQQGAGASVGDAACSVASQKAAPLGARWHDVRGVSAQMAPDHLMPPDDLTVDVPQGHSFAAQGAGTSSERERDGGPDVERGRGGAPARMRNGKRARGLEALLARAAGEDTISAADRRNVGDVGLGTRLGPNALEEVPAQGRQALAATPHLPPAPLHGHDPKWLEELPECLECGRPGLVNADGLCRPCAGRGAGGGHGAPRADAPDEGLDSVPGAIAGDEKETILAKLMDGDFTSLMVEAAERQRKLGCDGQSSEGRRDSCREVGMADGPSQGHLMGGLTRAEAAVLDQHAKQVHEHDGARDTVVVPASAATCEGRQDGGDVHKLGQAARAQRQAPPAQRRVQHGADANEKVKTATERELERIEALSRPQDAGRCRGSLMSERSDVADSSRRVGGASNADADDLGSKPRGTVLARKGVPVPRYAYSVESAGVDGGRSSLALEQGANSDACEGCGDKVPVNGSGLCENCASAAPPFDAQALLGMPNDRKERWDQVALAAARATVGLGPAIHAAGGVQKPDASSETADSVDMAGTPAPVRLAKGGDGQPCPSKKGWLNRQAMGSGVAKQREIDLLAELEAADNLMEAHHKASRADLRHGPAQAKMSSGSKSERGKQAVRGPCSPRGSAGRRGASNSSIASSSRPCDSSHSHGEPDDPIIKAEAPASSPKPNLSALWQSWGIEIDQRVVGVKVAGRQNCDLRVVSVSHGSKAEDAFISRGDRIVRVNKIDTRKLQAAGSDLSHLAAALRGPALQLTLSQGQTGRSIQTILRRDDLGDKTDEKSNELGSVGGGVDAELASRQARRRQVMAKRDHDSGHSNESRHEQVDALTDQASSRARIEAESHELGNVPDGGIRQGVTAEQQQQQGRPESKAVADGRSPQVLSDIEGDAHVREPVRVAMSAAALEATVRGAFSGLNERERITQLVRMMGELDPCQVDQPLQIRCESDFAASHNHYEGEVERDPDLGNGDCDGEAAVSCSEASRSCRPTQVQVQEQSPGQASHLSAQDPSQGPERTADLDAAYHQQWQRMQQRRLLHSQRPRPQASARSSIAVSGSRAGEAQGAAGAAGHAGGQRDGVDVAVSSSDDDGGHARVPDIAAHDSDPTCGEAAIDWDALRDQVDDHVAQRQRMSHALSSESKRSGCTDTKSWDEYDDDVLAHGHVSAGSDGASLHARPSLADKGQECALGQRGSGDDEKSDLDRQMQEQEERERGWLAAGDPVVLDAQPQDGVDGGMAPVAPETDGVSVSGNPSDRTKQSPQAVSGAVGWVLQLDQRWTDALQDDEMMRHKAQRDLSNVLSDLVPPVNPRRLRLETVAPGEDDAAVLLQCSVWPPEQDHADRRSVHQVIDLLQAQINDDRSRLRAGSLTRLASCAWLSSAHMTGIKPLERFCQNGREMVGGSKRRPKEVLGGGDAGLEANRVEAMEAERLRRQEEMVLWRAQLDAAEDGEPEGDAHAKDGALESDSERPGVAAYLLSDFGGVKALAGAPADQAAAAAARVKEAAEAAAAAEAAEVVSEEMRQREEEAQALALAQEEALREEEQIRRREAEEVAEARDRADALLDLCAPPPRAGEAAAKRRQQRQAAATSGTASTPPRQVLARVMSKSPVLDDEDLIAEERDCSGVAAENNAAETEDAHGKSFEGEKTDLFAVLQARSACRSMASQDTVIIGAESTAEAGDKPEPACLGDSIPLESAAAAVAAVGIGPKAGQQGERQQGERPPYDCRIAGGPRAHSMDPQMASEKEWSCGEHLCGTVLLDTGVAPKVMGADAAHDVVSKGSEADKMAPAWQAGHEADSESEDEDIMQTDRVLGLVREPQSEAEVHSALREVEREREKAAMACERERERQEKLAAEEQRQRCEMMAAEEQTKVLEQAYQEHELERNRDKDRRLRAQAAAAAAAADDAAYFARAGMHAIAADFSPAVAVPSESGWVARDAGGRGAVDAALSSSGSSQTPPAPPEAQSSAPLSLHAERHHHTSAEKDGRMLQRERDGSSEQRGKGEMQGGNGEDVDGGLDFEKHLALELDAHASRTQRYPRTADPLAENAPAAGHVGSTKVSLAGSVADEVGVGVDPLQSKGEVQAVESPGHETERGEMTEVDKIGLDAQHFLSRAAQEALQERQRARQKKLRKLYPCDADADLRNTAQRQRDLIGHDDASSPRLATSALGNQAQQAEGEPDTFVLPESQRDLDPGLSGNREEALHEDAMIRPTAGCKANTCRLGDMDAGQTAPTTTMPAPKINAQTFLAQRYPERFSDRHSQVQSVSTAHSVLPAQPGRGDSLSRLQSAQTLAVHHPDDKCSADKVGPSRDKSVHLVQEEEATDSKGAEPSHNGPRAGVPAGSVTRRDELRELMEQFGLDASIEEVVRENGVKRVQDVLELEDGDVQALGFTLVDRKKFAKLRAEVQRLLAAGVLGRAPVSANGHGSTRQSAGWRETSGKQLVDDDHAHDPETKVHSETESKGQEKAGMAESEAESVRVLDGHQENRQEEVDAQARQRERLLAETRYKQFIDRLRPHITRKAAGRLASVWRGHVGRRDFRDAKRQHQYRQRKALEAQEQALAQLSGNPIPEGTTLEANGKDAETALRERELDRARQQEEAEEDAEKAEYENALDSLACTSRWLRLRAACKAWRIAALDADETIGQGSSGAESEDEQELQHSPAADPVAAGTAFASSRDAVARKVAALASHQPVLSQAAFESDEIQVPGSPLSNASAVVAAASGGIVQADGYLEGQVIEGLGDQELLGGGSTVGCQELSAWGICAACECLVCTCTASLAVADNSSASPKPQVASLVPNAPSEDLEERGARKVQRVWRGREARRHVSMVRQQRKVARMMTAAIQIQAFVRGARLRARGLAVLGWVNQSTSDSPLDVQQQQALVQAAVLQRVRCLLDAKGLRGVSSQALAKTALQLGGLRVDRERRLLELRQHAAARLLQCVLVRARMAARRSRPEVGHDSRVAPLRTGASRRDDQNVAQGQDARTKAGAAHGGRARRDAGVSAASHAKQVLDAVASGSSRKGARKTSSTSRADSNGGVPAPSASSASGTVSTGDAVTTHRVDKPKRLEGGDKSEAKKPRKASNPAPAVDAAAAAAAAAAARRVAASKKNAARREEAETVQKAVRKAEADKKLSRVAVKLAEGGDSLAMAWTAPAATTHLASSSASEATTSLSAAANRAPPALLREESRPLAPDSSAEAPKSRPLGRHNSQLATLRRPQQRSLSPHGNVVRVRGQDSRSTQLGRQSDANNQLRSKSKDATKRLPLSQQKERGAGGGRGRKRDKMMLFLGGDDDLDTTLGALDLGFSGEGGSGSAAPMGLRPMSVDPYDEFDPRNDEDVSTGRAWSNIEPARPLSTFSNFSDVSDGNNGELSGGEQEGMALGQEDLHGANRGVKMGWQDAALAARTEDTAGAWAELEARITSVRADMRLAAAAKRYQEAENLKEVVASLAAQQRALQTVPSGSLVPDETLQEAGQGLDAEPGLETLAAQLEALHQKRREMESAASRAGGLDGGNRVVSAISLHRSSESEEDESVDRKGSGGIFDDGVSLASTWSPSGIARNRVKENFTQTDAPKHGPLPTSSQRPRGPISIGKLGVLQGSAEAHHRSSLSASGRAISLDSSEFERRHSFSSRGDGHYCQDDGDGAGWRSGGGDLRLQNWTAGAADGQIGHGVYFEDYRLGSAASFSAEGQYGSVGGGRGLFPAIGRKKKT